MEVVVVGGRRWHRGWEEVAQGEEEREWRAKKILIRRMDGEAGGHLTRLMLFVRKCINLLDRLWG